MPDVMLQAKAIIYPLIVFCLHLSLLRAHCTEGPAHCNFVPKASFGLLLVQKQFYY